jgi:hypothetical protein
VSTNANFLLASKRKFWWIFLDGTPTMELLIYLGAAPAGSATLLASMKGGYYYEQGGSGGFVWQGATSFFVRATGGNNQIFYGEVI